MERRDGISYLEAVKHRGVNTPLIGEYEAEILLQTDAPAPGRRMGSSPRELLKDLLVQ